MRTSQHSHIGEALTAQANSLVSAAIQFSHALEAAGASSAAKIYVNRRPRH